MHADILVQYYTRHDIYVSFRSCNAFIHCFKNCPENQIPDDKLMDWRTEKLMINMSQKLTMLPEDFPASELTSEV